MLNSHRRRGVGPEEDEELASKRQLLETLAGEAAAAAAEARLAIMRVGKGVLDGAGGGLDGTTCI